jgi:hypothetical protein
MARKPPLARFPGDFKVIYHSIRARGGFVKFCESAPGHPATGNGGKRGNSAMPKKYGSVSDPEPLGPEGFYVIPSQCGNCIHFHGVSPFTCAAFPDGIPYVILRNQFDHRKLHPDDGGVTWRARDASRGHPCDGESDAM